VDIARIRFDDPENLGEPSRIFISSMITFELLDYSKGITRCHPSSPN